MGFKSTINDKDFIKLWNELGSPTLVAKQTKMNPRSVMNKRAAIEAKYDIELATHNSQRDKKKLKKIEMTPHNVRRGIDIDKVKRVLLLFL